MTAEHLENLRYVMVGAAPVGKALEQRWQAKAPGDTRYIVQPGTEVMGWINFYPLLHSFSPIGVPLREGYGMTESTPMTIMTR